MNLKQQVEATTTFKETPKTLLDNYIEAAELLKQLTGATGFTNLTQENFLKARNIIASYSNTFAI